MANSLIVLHAASQAVDNRALTAIRLAGALLADDKEVDLFLVEDGARLADPELAEDNPCQPLFHEMIAVGMRVFVCGFTMRKLGWEENMLSPGIARGSMKMLSALMSQAKEIVTL